jgi:ankyrin repeat protein
MIAACFGGSKTCQILIKIGADVKGKDEYGATALMNAAGTCHLEICQQLINAGADVTIKSGAGNTALVVAAYMGDIKLCQLSLDKEDDPNDRRCSLWDTSVLMTAAHYGHAEFCRLLIDNGADLYLRKRFGKIAYDFATGSVEVSILQLKNGPASKLCCSNLFLRINFASITY